MADPTTLTALSPLDGRYDRKAAPLRPYLSEFGLIRYRVLVEVRWLQHLADEPSLTDLRAARAAGQGRAQAIVDNFSLDDAKQVKAIEAEINHDVKAVEYYLRQQLDGSVRRRGQFDRVPAFR